MPRPSKMKQVRRRVAQERERQRRERMKQRVSANLESEGLGDGGCDDLSDEEDADAVAEELRRVMG